MGRHDATLFTKARDELMSHTIRCDVLEAHLDDRMSWLSDTLDYMAGRYPQLSDLELSRLEAIGREFIRPVIPHGAKYTAVEMDREAA
ncbi:MAG: hypothetical protein RQ745_03915 [Longimicrobiales bacterium]|nr:hypothetical protein [Longimicrobiales bacterium]